MIFLSVCSMTLVFFDHSGDIIHINILTSVRVEPTNAVCAPSTAASDVAVLGAHATFVGSTLTAVKIFHFGLQSLVYRKSQVEVCITQYFIECAVYTSP